MSESTPGVATAASDRRSFVRAFVRGPHRQGKPSRLALRPATLIAVVVVAAVIAVAIGAIPALIHSGGSTSTSANGGTTPSSVAMKSATGPSNNATPLTDLGLSSNNGGGVGGGGLSTSSGSGGGLSAQDASGTGAGFGAGGGQGGSTAAPPAPPRPAQHFGAASVSHPTYSEVVGQGCANHNARYATSVTPGTNGWLKSAGGGYRANGCDGEYDAIPMWGSTSGWDQGAFSAYQWDFSSMFAVATCHFSVYVPDNTPTYVGGNPAFYHYWTSSYYNSKARSGFDQFTVNQVGSLGRWVDSPGFGVSSGHVSLIVVNTGVDNRGQHIAAAPISLTCIKS